MILIIFVSLIFVTLVNGAGKYPPKITSSFERAYYINPNADITFNVTCTADGNPSPSYYWKYNGLKLETTINRVVNKGMLLLKRGESRYLGDYQCFAENTEGTTMSSTFKVEFSELSDFRPAETMVVSAGLSESATLICRGKPVCVPAERCNYEWKLGSGTLNSIVSDPRIAVNAQGDLYFLYTTKDDKKDNTYGCGVWNEEQQVLKKGGFARLEIVGDTEKNVPARLLSFDDVKVFEGKTAVLQCIFSGRPLPEVTWINPKDNTVIDPSTMPDFKYGVFPESGKINRRQLIIENAQEKHQGKYMCNASTIADGSNPESGVLGLDVTGPPKFVEPLRPQIKPVGTSAQFHCKTRSLDPPSVKGSIPQRPQWYENGILLTQNMFGDTSRKFSISQDGTTLFVNKLQMSYTCNFQCSVKNDKGTSYAETYLLIIENIKNTTGIPTQRMVLPGETASFFMNATTDPRYKLNYNWEFTNITDDDKIVKQKDFPPAYLTVSDDNQTLTLNMSTFTTASDVHVFTGVYTVTVSHPFDRKTFSVKVRTNETIPEKAPIVVTTSASIDPALIAIICGVILIIIVIFLIFCLVFRNRGGIYNVDKKEVAAGHDPAKELENGGLPELSRAYDNPKSDRLSLISKDDLTSDDEDLQEYDVDDEFGKFNEDGSFIGQYGQKKAPPTQSTV